MARSNWLEPESLRAAIRETGLRATPGRIATLKLLRQSESPMTHAEVAEKVDSLAIDKVTAFRNLNDLAAAGLLRRTDLGDHVYRFEAACGDATLDAHPHFVCVDCGSVTCLDAVQLTTSNESHQNLVGNVTEILLRGHCTSCE